MDTFFTKTKCDRCDNGLGIRTMSWFTTEALCPECIEKERKIRKNLSYMAADYEGCGYIPKVKGK